MLDPSQFLSALVECGALWVNSGLEESLQNLSDGVDFQCNETAKALVISIKNICDLDVFTVHDGVVLEHKLVCRISLLPQEMMGKKLSSFLLLTTPLWFKLDKTYCWLRFRYK